MKISAILYYRLEKYATISYFNNLLFSRDFKQF